MHMNSSWHLDAMVYHIYTLSFANAPFQNDYVHKGCALREIEKWIPHITNLGFNAILLSPLFKSRTHGYDVTDYYQVDNRVGTNEDLIRFVALCHDNGIRVVLDSVFNHSGRDFFAFSELSRGNREYAPWYSGVDFGRASPLGDPFAYDTWSGYSELPKFNLKNEATRRYLRDATGYWIETFDIDGMRLDAANELDFGFMGELRRATSGKKPDFWLMGEVVHGDYSRWVGDGALHSVTNYMLFKSLFSSHNDNNLFELAHCLRSAAPSQGLPLYNFLDNHDQPRIASSVKTPGFLTTLYTLLFTLPGIPSIYYGSEWGIKGRKEAGSDAPLRPYIDIESPPAGITGLEDFIRRLAALRRRHAGFRRGEYRQISCEYRRPFVFERRYADERIVVAVNIEDRPLPVDLSGCQCPRLLDLLSGDTIEPKNLGNVIVPPCSPRILKVE